MERAHSVLPSNIKSYLIQSKLSKSYFNYALRHVMDCRKVVPHRKPKQTHFELLFGKLSTEVLHIRTFCCCVEFRPRSKQIGRFESRIESEFNLFYEGGVIYRIKTERWTVRTEHVNIIEHIFPRSTSHSYFDSNLTEMSDTESSSCQSTSSVSDSQDS